MNSKYSTGFVFSGCYLLGNPGNGELDIRYSNNSEHAYREMDSLRVKSKQISSFIGLVSSKDYYKRPRGVLRVCGKGHLGDFFVGQCVLWDSPNLESVLASAGTAYLFVELIGKTAYPFAGWMCAGG